MHGLQPDFPAHLTPLERGRLSRLIARLSKDARVTRVRLFGSRARGRSHPGSDIDVAVDLSVGPARDVERWLASEAMEAHDDGMPPLQLVAVYAGQPTRLDRALAREGVVLWARS